MNMEDRPEAALIPAGEESSAVESPFEESCGQHTAVWLVGGGQGGP